MRVLCRWKPALLSLSMTGALSLVLGGCGSSTTAPTAPANLDSILSLTLADPAGDFQIAPQEGPPAVVQYPPADVVSYRLGVEGQYLYLQVNYAAAIPGGPVTIPAQQGMPVQFVREQGCSFDFNVDGNVNTGASGFPAINGIDIFFGIKLLYGTPPQAYANYDFTNNDIHLNRGHIDGVVLDGGAGSTRVTARFDVSTLGSFFPRGAAVMVGGWSEAESSDAAGNTIYHHFAFDPVPAVAWTIPR
jgi:hypothetical protein